ncbi:hypothetical protein BU14_0445s0011 [Porphyra umbilicalis]|uniref:Uncharacterized protein n=1 Tax=Porphyra umbilicalis TaxID=2786 RepID=A0A1X6NUM6_PORUM|nr:hypothetical protein BU14_0445s0011 [Porphyra umbilicalis]|eukprot:OSX72329.1 hypothetical protein BU14_0445s0011 [Porphyra umbilicalis]
MSKWKATTNTWCTRCGTFVGGRAPHRRCDRCFASHRSPPHGRATRRGYTTRQRVALRSCGRGHQARHQSPPMTHTPPTTRQPLPPRVPPLPAPPRGRGQRRQRQRHPCGGTERGRRRPPPTPPRRPPVPDARPHTATRSRCRRHHRRRRRTRG